MRKAIAITSIYLLFTSISFADECRDGLIPNITTVKFDRTMTLALLKVMTTEERNQFARSKDGALEVPGYFGLDFSENKSEDQWSTFFSKYQFDLSEKESLDLLVINVPDTARKQFFDCVVETSKKNGKAMELRVGSNLGNILDITLVRNQRQGTTANQPFPIKWASSDKIFEKQLNENKSLQTLGGPGAEIAVDYPSYDPGKGFFLTVSGDQIVAKLNVPPVPKIPEAVLAPWYVLHHVSIPLKVRTHAAQVGDRCFTINVTGEQLPDVEPSGCPKNMPRWVRLDGNAGDAGSQIQEIEVNWDSDAAKAFNVPSPLKADQLSFGVRCQYVAIFSPPQGYPKDATEWAKPGETCGNQNELGGEPLLTAFTMKLTGSLSKYFELTYSCFNGAWHGPYVAGASCAPGGRISQLRIEIDSRGER